MKRKFLMVRGKPGALVSDPRALDANPRRFVGMTRVDAAEGAEHIERYRPTEQVVESHQHILDAIAAGDLAKLGFAVADDAESAAKMMTPKKGKEI